MKTKTLIVLLVTLIFSAPVFSQTQSWSRVARGAALPAKVWPSGYLYFRTADSTLFVSTGTTWNAVKTLEWLEIRADEMTATASNGTTDSTVYYIPMKMFALDDTATFDFTVSGNFVQIDSIVAFGGTISTLGDSAAMAFQIMQMGVDSSYVGAFNTARIDTVDLGAGSVQKKWIVTQLGAVTPGIRSRFRVKVWRSACANSTGSKVFIEAILVYIIGLL